MNAMIITDATTATPEVMAALQAHGHAVEGIDLYKPTFDEVFVRLLQQQKEVVNG